MVLITLNGKREEIIPSTLIQLVQNKGLEPNALVIEYNGVIVKKEQWPSIHIKENDEIELLSFVGGG